MVHVCVSSSVMSDSETPWTVVLQAPLTMEFFRQEHWSGARPFPKESSQCRDGTHASCIAGRFFTVWATREVLRVNCISKEKNYRNVWKENFNRSWKEGMHREDFAEVRGYVREERVRKEGGFQRGACGCKRGSWRKAGRWVWTGHRDGSEGSANRRKVRGEWGVGERRRQSSRCWRSSQVGGCFPPGWVRFTSWRKLETMEGGHHQTLHLGRSFQSDH